MTTFFENRKTTAYENGRIAAKQGYDIVDNPHERHDLTRLDWNRGFRDEAAGKPQVPVTKTLAVNAAPYTPAEKDEAARRFRNDDEIDATIRGLSAAFRMGIAAWCQGEPRQLDDNASVDYSVRARHDFLSGYDLAQLAEFPRQDRVVSLEGERPFSMPEFLEAVAVVARDRGL